MKKSLAISAIASLAVVFTGLVGMIGTVRAADNERDAIQKYLKDAMTGHRPTWAMGRNGSSQSTARSGRAGAGRPKDPFGLFGEDGAPRPESRRPKVRPLEKKAFENLDLEPGSSGETIRRRYKDLVKQLHPDANGGDRSQEDRLREVIQAYKLLKQAGLC